MKMIIALKTFSSRLIVCFFFETACKLEFFHTPWQYVVFPTWWSESFIKCISKFVLFGTFSVSCITHCPVTLISEDSSNVNSLGAVTAWEGEENLCLDCCRSFSSVFYIYKKCWAGDVLVPVVSYTPTTTSSWLWTRMSKKYFQIECIFTTCILEINRGYIGYL